MKIAIYGYYNYQNAGDEAFKLVFTKILSGHEITFFNTGSLPNYEKQFDVLILGGGNVLGSYFFKPLIGRNWLNCPEKYAIGVGLSDSYGLEALDQFNFKKILVRNFSEIEKFNSSNTVEFVPDIVFALYKDNNLFNFETSLPEISKEYKKEKTIGFILSLEYFPEFNLDDKFEEYYRFDKSISSLSNAIENLRLTYNISLIAISSDPYHYDEIYSRLLYRACPNAWKNVAIINTLGDPETSLSIIKKHDCIISMKYHGLVFSMISDVPAINISRNIKNNDLMNHAGLEKFNVALLNDDFNAEHFKGLVEEAIATQDNFVKITQNYHNESLEKLNSLSMLAKAL